MYMDYFTMSFYCTILMKGECKLTRIWQLLLGKGFVLRSASHPQSIYVTWTPWEPDPLSKGCIELPQQCQCQGSTCSANACSPEAIFCHCTENHK
jgi:hypothetical protein